MGVKYTGEGKERRIVSECEACGHQLVFAVTFALLYGDLRAPSHDNIVNTQRLCHNEGWTFEHGLWRCPTCSEART